MSPVTGDFEQLEEMQRVLSEASRGDLRDKLNTGSAATALKLAQMGFRTGVDPYGKPWPALKTRKGGKPLRDTGRLANSFTARPTSEGFVVGTNATYAPHHQFGAPKAGIPARAMVPQPTMSEPWVSAITQSASEALENYWKRFTW